MNHNPRLKSNLAHSSSALRAAALVALGLSLSSGAGAHTPAAPAPKAPATKSPATKTPAAKPTPKAAPGFTLPGSDGKTHSLTEYRGRSTAIFFYCGCRWCHRHAASWSTVQRSGTLAQISSNQPRNSNGSTQSKGNSAPMTLVVFLGDKQEVLDFAKETHLDLKQTVFLSDPDEKVSSLYKAAPCPRVFVVDALGNIRYTNNEMGAESYKIPAPLITARTLDALRAVAAKPVATKPVAAPIAKKPAAPKSPPAAAPKH